MLGGNNAFLTASLVARLSLGVSSDWEPAAHPTGPKGGNWSSAALFSVRCLVTMSWHKHREGETNVIMQNGSGSEAVLEPFWNFDSLILHTGAHVPHTVKNKLTGPSINVALFPKLNDKLGTY